MKLFPFLLSRNLVNSFSHSLPYIDLTMFALAKQCSGATHIYDLCLYLSNSPLLYSLAAYVSDQHFSVLLILAAKAHVLFSHFIL